MLNNHPQRCWAFHSLLVMDLIMEGAQCTGGVMTQAMLAVKQWHMAKLHKIKHFGDFTSLVRK